MGEILGRYHIISELGRGGMGVVYKALDPKLERFIAIKCLNEELSADEIVVARFLREARNVAALNHPNIAQIFVADEHDGKPYFVMEYVDGESLADFIDREGQCSPEMARRVTEQAAKALAAAAEEGIVHRDVKPGNIMIDRRGRAVLTDFGIACIAAEQSGASDQIMGTPGYLAPEALSGGPVDSRSDMFALGAVWFEMLAGERLMPGRELKDTFSQLARGNFPDLCALEGKVDDRVIDIMGRLLAVQPENRYADWSELLADMQPLKTGRTGPVERSDTAPSTAEREVTEALATASKSRQTAATSTATAPETTAVLQTPPQRSHPVPVHREAPNRRGRWVVALLVLVVALAGAGFGLARLDPATWSRITAWLPASDEAAVASSAASDAERDSAAQPAAAREGGTAADAGAGLRAGQAIAGGGGSGSGSDSSPAGDRAAENPAADTQATAHSGEANSSVSGSEPLVDATGEETTATAQTTPVEESGEADVAPESGREMAMVEARPDASPIDRAPTRAEPRVAPPPRGIVVIGVGDPVVADPMVREIESALRGGSHPVIQRSFVKGFRDHVQGEEINLAGLAGPALDAGARYLVVARALPAGERELQYYNRIETAYIAQLEAVTYDLHAMRQMGASPVEQIEFTSLNATRRAVDSVRPWLAGIRDQFD